MTQISTEIGSIKEEQEQAKAELLEMLSRFGWKWAVMASTVGKLYKKEEPIPTELLNKIRMSKTQIESGCYSVCDIATAIREVETPLFSKLMKYGPQETDNFLELISKAINGTITREDIDLKGAQPILTDCLTLPCVCQE